MASQKEIIADAKRLLAAGEAAEAQRLLVDEGYVKRAEPALQSAYLALIPASPTLQLMLDTIYQGLDDPDPKVRFDAANKLSREFSKQTVRDNVRWMRDPRASGPLIDAAHDPVAKVSERALGALTRLVCRFFPDQRALSVFQPRLEDPKQLVRSNAIVGIGCLRREDAVELLTPLFETGTDEDRMAVAGVITGLAHETWYDQHQHPIEWTTPGREAWKDRMITGLRDPHAGVRRQAANALNYFGDPRAIPALREARRVEPEGDTTVYAAYYMDEAITALEARA